MAEERASLGEYQLRAPGSAAEWAEYHRIRRHVLFELRGHADRYNADHPDETKPGNFPLLLLHYHEIIGVVRIDVAPPVAILRRVAIRADRQRRGHGTALLLLAEAFATQHRCRELLSYVAADAVPFYAACGFQAVGSAGNDHPSVQMTKAIQT